MRCPVCRYKVKRNTAQCPYCAAVFPKRKQPASHPYYAREFERLAQGQAARFNAAAFFGGMFHTLYHRCYARFFRLFAPYLLVLLLLTAAYFMRLPYFLWQSMFGGSSVTEEPQFLLAVALCAVWGLGLAIYNANTFNAELYKKTGGDPHLKTTVWACVVIFVLFAALCTAGIFYTQRLLLFGVLDYAINGGYQYETRVDDHFYVTPGGYAVFDAGGTVKI